MLQKISPPDPSDPKGDIYFFEAGAQLPAGATGIRFRNESTLDHQFQSWFLDTVLVDGSPLTLSGNWLRRSEHPSQDIAVQVAATCDLTPGVDTEGEWQEAGYHLYRWLGTSFTDQEFTSWSDEEFLVMVSGLSDRPTEGAMDVSYALRLITLDDVPTDPEPPAGETAGITTLALSLKR